MRQLVYVCIVCVLAGAVTLPPLLAPSTAQAQQVAGLEDILLNGLKARLPVDRAFIKKVVRYVEMKKLPLKPVMEIFQYCREKISSQRRATVFRILLTRRAARMGIRL